MPIYVPPIIHPLVGAPLATDLARAAALMRDEPRLAAVHLTSPTYYGTCSDVAGFAALAHAANLPLLVDEAHGAHFIFHETLPQPALAAGADLVIQSMHKTLGSLTQSSLLHVREGRIDLRALNTALSALQSSSPSALLLASLDAARDVMAERGPTLLAEAVRLSQAARGAIQDIPGLWCYGDELLEGGHIHSYDATKLLVRVADLGLTGHQAGRLLEEAWQVEPELWDPRHLLFTVTFADTEESLSRLLEGLRWLAGQARGSEAPAPSRVLMPPEMPHMALTPREAYFAESEAVPLRAACGRICAEAVIPYPPGIPTLMPGELVEADTIEYLSELAAGGAKFVGVEDAGVRSLRVTAGRRA